MTVDEVASTSGEATPRDSERWLLRLYVAGETTKCIQAYANLKRLCETHLADRYDIEIVDLLAHPLLARADEIIAVPTLVRRIPSPIRTIIGDLSDTERVLVGLQLRPKQHS